MLMHKVLSDADTATRWSLGTGPHNHLRRKAITSESRKLNKIMGPSWGQLGPTRGDPPATVSRLWRGHRGTGSERQCRPAMPGDPHRIWARTGSNTHCFMHTEVPSSVSIWDVP